MSAINDKTVVLRLQSGEKDISGLTNGIQDWHKYDNSLIYDDDQVSALESSNKESLSQPTSIPSPFARIALVKTAFGEVATHREQALKAYQKIVSDTLDVAEIFFTFDKWENKIDIIKWDKVEDLKKLEDHKVSHKTLKTFLENDAAAYNFDVMKAIYILKHKKSGEMIGATSPCTLFFSSANDLSKIDIQLNFTRKAFTDIVPLSDRSWDFQKYLYAWFSANNITDKELGRQVGNSPASIFNEFEKYLTAQKEISIEKGRSAKDFEISFDPEKYKQFGSPSPDVEVLGKMLYQSAIESRDTLTANDLLEDKLIRLPYEIRKESFFDGNLQKNSKHTYLLPIKDKFFKYFSIEDLKKFIKINHSGDVAKVMLEIDGKEYDKQYKKSDGTIIEPSRFDCAIFPNVRFAKDEEAHYRFGLVCNFSEKEKFRADFMKIGAEIMENKKRESVRNETFSKDDPYLLKNYSLEGSNFDYVKINYNNASGIVVPALIPKNGNQEFMFAVDFGTTNTHIEYKIGTANEQKLDILEVSKDKIDECQVHWLHGREETLGYIFDEEFIPAYTDSEFKFPMRSALSFGEKTNWSNVEPFEKVSPAVLYEKRLESPYNEITTDLKWSDSADNGKQVTAYIESLMFLLRNKVIIGNGDLSETKIRWFYPVAMDGDRYKKFETAWNDAYKKYFGNNMQNIVPITESVAPFEYYVRDHNSNHLVTIDIGGGTTDIVIANDGKADFITSFRFAANAIFGDGYSETGRVKNGIVMQFAKAIKQELQAEINGNDELFRIFQKMMDEKNSSDIASFLFSVGNSKKVMSAGKKLSENANLSKKIKERPKSQEITLIFFYSAIIYHLAKLMKAKKLEMPDRIVFSGNGSRVISLFTNDRNLLIDYTKLIFTKVFNEEYPANGLDIILNENEPKEATCKGGFYAKEPEPYNVIFKKKVVLHSNGTNAVIKNPIEYNKSPEEKDRNKAIDKDYLTKTAEEAKKFIDFVFELLPFFANNGYKLNADSVNIAKDACYKKLDIYTQNGWNLKKKDVSDDAIIEETLFFYPLVGMLKELGNAICDRNLSNKK